MADNRQAAIAELARRELARRKNLEKTGLARHLPLSEYEEPGELERTERTRARTGQALVESVPSGISGLADASVAGWRGIYDTLMPGGLSGPEAVERQMGTLQYEPRTEGGQIFEESMQEIGAAHQNLADQIAVGTGNEETKLGNTLVYTAAMVAPLFFARRGKKVSPRQSVAKMDDLIKRKNEAYQAASDASVAVRGDSFTKFIDDVTQVAAKEGISDKLHPRALSVLEGMRKRSGQHHTLDGLDIYRKQLNDAMGASDEAMRMAYIIKRKLDDYIDNLSDADVISGDPKYGVGQLREAQGLARRIFEAQDVGELIRRAELSTNYTGSGFENALRNEFRRVAKNSDNFRSYSPQVRQAMLDVVKGGTFLRDIGRMAPKSGLNAAAGGGVGALIGGAVAGPPGALVGGVAPVLAGQLARGAATRRTTRAALLAEELARRGGRSADPKAGLRADLLRDR